MCVLLWNCWFLFVYYEFRLMRWLYSGFCERLRGRPAELPEVDCFFLLVVGNLSSKTRGCSEFHVVDVLTG
jgi:hypothetical protein